MSVARIVLRNGYKDIQYQPLPKEIEDAEDGESPLSVGGCSLDIATTPTSSTNEQQRLLTDDGEANIPLQTDDPEFNELISEVLYIRLSMHLYNTCCFSSVLNYHDGSFVVIV